jgi:hypothetical protein
MFTGENIKRKSFTYIVKEKHSTHLTALQLSFGLFVFTRASHG